MQHENSMTRVSLRQLTTVPSLEFAKQVFMQRKINQARLNNIIYTTLYFESLVAEQAIPKQFLHDPTIMNDAAFLDNAVILT